MSIPIYWKNSVINELSGTGTFNSAADMIFMGPDKAMYITGYYYNKGRRFCYWKDGVFIDPLPSDYYSSSAAIAVGQDGAVYVITWWFGTSVYWKDKVQIASLPPDFYTVSQSRAAVGKDGAVYIVGQRGNYPDYRPCYWKNGEEIELSDSNGKGDAWAVTIDEVGDVYIAGFHNDNTTACYWKNGVRTDLPGASVSLAYGITIDREGTVYVVGCHSYAMSTPCYWKDGVKTDLSYIPDSYGGATAYRIAIGEDGTVYTSGFPGTDIVCYWKNEERIDLPGSALTTMQGIMLIEK